MIGGLLVLLFTSSFVYAMLTLYIYHVVDFDMIDGYIYIDDDVSYNDDLMREHDDVYVRSFIRDALVEIIRKMGDRKWCLYSKKKGKNGKRRRLGCYSSRKGAEERELQVNRAKYAKGK